MYIFVPFIIIYDFFSSYYYIILLWFFIGFCAAVSVCARLLCRMRVRDHKIMINNDREDARRTRICTLSLYTYIYIYMKIKGKKIKYTYRRERWEKKRV